MGGVWGRPLAPQELGGGSAPPCVGLALAVASAPAPAGWEAGLAVAQWRLGPLLDRKVKVPEPWQAPGWQCKTDGEW